MILDRSVALDTSIEQKLQSHVINDIQTTDKIVGRLVHLEDFLPALLASSQVFACCVFINKLERKVL